MGEESETAADAAAEPEETEGEAAGGEGAISEETFADLAAREEFVLSVTEKGFGVRSSAYDYRITGRGGQGINNMDLSRRSDAIVAVFPVGHNDQVMLVTDGGMVIRCPVARHPHRPSAQPGGGDLQGRRRRAGRLGGAASRGAPRNGTARQTASEMSRPHDETGTNVTRGTT